MRVVKGIFLMLSQLHAVASKSVLIPLSLLICSLSLISFRNSIFANSPKRSIPARNPSPRNILFASSNMRISSFLSY